MAASSYISGMKIGVDREKIRHERYMNASTIHVTEYTTWDGTGMKEAWKDEFSTIGLAMVCYRRATEWGEVMNSGIGTDNILQQFEESSDSDTFCQFSTINRLFSTTFFLDIFRHHFWTTLCDIFFRHHFSTSFSDIRTSNTTFATT